MYRRLQEFVGLGKESCFLWGARQTGKSTLLRSLFPDSPYYDLLLSDEFERLNRRPKIFRDELLSGLKHKGLPIIVDEVQKVPILLDEIQWLIVNHNLQFILCGSSARKLKRGHGNLLGGRAIRYELYPLVYKEIPDFNLMHALNSGLLPRHYAHESPERLIKSYVGDYLKEEIMAEALTRNIPAFGRFMEASAFSNGEIVNYNNIASECGVSAPTVKEYFQILEDTLIGRFVPSFQKRPKRRVILAPKFYFFDVGLANYLLKRGTIVDRSEAFGKAFEHFICQEIFAHRHYCGKDYSISYWRTASQLEVDFILGDHELAIEVKGAHETQGRHLKGLRAFQEEYKVKRAIVVSLDTRIRKTDGIWIYPWKDFLDELWSGALI